MNFKKSVLVAAVAGVMLAGCSAVQGFFGDDTVVATAPEYVLEEGEAVEIPLEALPEDIREKLPEELRDLEVVVVGKEGLIGPDAPHVPLTGNVDEWLTEGAFSGVFATVFGALKAFFPSLAAWEFILAMFFARKRKHWLNALKNLIPWANGDSGEVAAVEAAKDAAKAIGAVHSSPTTEEVFDAELEGEKV